MRATRVMHMASTTKHATKTRHAPRLPILVGQRLSTLPFHRRERQGKTQNAQKREKRGGESKTQLCFFSCVEYTVYMYIYPLPLFLSVTARHSRNIPQRL